ncbi:MAG: bifunctional hydroxymethylpyrimidine kinase/phosphomethylpyrimidine kinase, partial [Synergistes jonesii]|uniref:bifunctional hydroxymethylpyrimidine kinase/phosphomethylpyrimidine kinase n=1 Tax=Synergistes jonesii TaxID=2754 RepID=UPI002A75A6AA
IPDVLYTGAKISLLRYKISDTKANHGRGCPLSSAIAAELAAGCRLEEAVGRGRKYLRAGLLNGVTAGHGAGCLGHAVEMPWIEAAHA